MPGSFAVLLFVMGLVSHSGFITCRELLHEIENLRFMRRQRQDSDSDASEREWLQDEKERLEVKQEILESHNKQLELQLQRLRHLIGQVRRVLRGRKMS